MNQHLLLSLLVHWLVVSGQPQTTTTATTATVNAFHPNNATWQHTLLHALSQVASDRSDLQSAATGNHSGERAQLMASWLSELPAVMRGLEGVDVREGDVGRLLAKLFADPRAAGTPAWIESLTQGGTPTLTQDTLPSLRSLTSQGPGVQTQALLAKVFADVTSGLQSVNLSANSSLMDVVSAVMSDPGLMSSLSTDAIQLLGALTGSTDLPATIQEAFPVDPNSQCAADLLVWASGLQKGDIWALQMMDAMGKLGAGVLTGQLALAGDYVECTEASFSNSSYSLTTHVCPMAFSAPGPLAPYVQNQPLVMHLCMPKSCEVDHIYGLFYPTLEAIGSEHRGTYCVGPRKPEKDDRFIGVTSMLAALVLLCAAGTVYGLVLDRRTEKQKKQSKSQQVEPKAYTNNAYVTDGDHAKNHVNGSLASGISPSMANGNHMKNGMTNGNISDVANGSHVLGGLTNGGPPSLPNGSHTTDGLSNGDVSSVSKGSHVLGGLTIGDVPNNGSHVIGGLTNGDVPNVPGGDHVKGVLPVSYVKHCEGEEKKVDLKDVEGAVVVTEAPSGTKTSGGSSRPAAQQSLGSQALLSFSVVRNGAKLLSCHQNQTDIGCLHGIRVLSMCWVVLGHAFSMLDPVTGNIVSKNLELENLSFMVIPAGVLAVDTFFLLSGCLSAFLFLRTTKKSGLTVSGLVLYYIHRVWRLTPLYAVFVAFYVGIFPYLKEGPFMYHLGLDSETTCRDYWHLNLLYVNNLVSGSMSKMCFGWSWYLSNDMQFSFIAPLVIIPWTLKGRWRRLRVLGFLLCAGLILTHCIATGVISYKEDAYFFGPNVETYMEKIYFVPWTRVGPYAVGLLLGYLLYITPPKYSMDRLSVFLGWTVATAVALTVVYVRYDDLGEVTTKGNQWTTSQAAAYEALDKVLWAGCVAWVVFACCKGHGGVVNTLLSWRAWMPLSRLAYGVYLVHCVVFYVIGGNLRRPLYMDSLTATYLFLATTVLSFLVSFIFSLLVEAPTLGLEKAVLGKILRTKK